MKKIFVVLLVVFSVFSAALAQSGRRVKTFPQPTQQQRVENDEPEYSESAPNKPRNVYIPPSLRRTIQNRDKKDQQKPTPQATPSTVSGNETLSGGDDEVLKIETNLITIPVSVYDRSGLYIPNLRQSDFKIFEDGAEQEIAYFGTSDKPFTVILLIDTSPSTEYKIEEIQQAAIAFVDQLKPEDNVMVIEFDSNVHVLTELTNDRQKIYKAINRADFGDGTALYDAVEFSLRKRLSKIEGKKAIVLFTDGVDTTSRNAGYETTVLQAEESEAMIFPIYYNTLFDTLGMGRGGGGVMNNPSIMGIPFPTGSIGGGGGVSRAEITAAYARGKAYLEDLAASTGGRVFRPESTPGGLTNAFEGIAEELRRQYNIGYYPQNEGQIGQRKQIKVRVNRPNVAVRARHSYIVGGGGTTQAAATK